jgi:hypothetical protein
MNSEHEHYGPYMYLEVMTSPEAGMDDHSIHGPIEDLRRLASLLERHITSTEPGSSARVREEFSPASKYSLVLHVREDHFDPASSDANLSAG